MNTAAIAADWADDLFGTLDWGHRRRTRRWVQIAAAAAAHPSGCVAKVFGADAAAAQAAYDFLERPDLSPRPVARAQAAATLRAVADEPYVVVPIDFTDVRVTDTTRAKGTGRLRTDRRPRRGFHVLSALVLRPAGTTVGVAVQRWTTWPDAPVGDPHRRPLDQKETRHWGPAGD